MNKRQKFFWWKLGITVLSFVTLVLIKSDIDWCNPSNNYWDIPLCKDIIFDLSGGIFSSMILVWFIDEIHERIQDTENKKTEIEKIRRVDRILQIYIERYQIFFYCVVTPIDQRDFENIEMPLHFSFKDMRELYLTSMLIGDNLLGSSIQSFCRAEDQLKEQIELALRDIEFHYFPDIKETLLNFIEISLKYNQKEAWLSVLNTASGKNKLADTIKDVLEFDADTRYEEIKSGQKSYSHNLVHIYIALYEMLNQERDVILKYNSLIKSQKIYEAK